MNRAAAVICLISVLFTAQAHKINTKEDDSRDITVTLPPDCVGQEFCLTKPIDYPSEHVDRVARRLQTRSKRHNDVLEPAKVDEGNGCAASRQMIQPFLAVYNETRHIVIQSEFYKQTLPSVMCKKEGAECLEDLKFPGIKPTCSTKFSAVYLTVLDRKESLVKNIRVSFPIDCACALKDRV